MKDKNNNNDSITDVKQHLTVLKRQVLSLAGVVEAVFAESIIAIVDGDSAAAHDARLEDYKAHKIWLNADSLALELFTDGEFSAEEINRIYTMSHLALNLKQMADKGMEIAGTITSGQVNNFPSGACRETLSKMAEITQSMFSNSIEAFINRDPSEANGLHPLFNEVQRLYKELRRGLAEALESGSAVTPESALSGLLIGGCLEDIAGFALENGARIARLYKEESHWNSNSLDGERE